MLILVLTIISINVLVYILSYVNWRNDCKDIGKDMLAVSLSERIAICFFCFTLPCLIGFLISKR